MIARRTRVRFRDFAWKEPVVLLVRLALLDGIVSGWHRKAHILGMALILTALVRMSRVYMGVHYPTGVLAGWAVGLSWTLLCWLAERWLQRRGQVEDGPLDEGEAITT